MRICYLINGLNGGGAAFPMVAVIRLMQARGHEVSVIACMKQDGRAAERLEQAAIPYKIIGRGIFDIVSSSAKLLQRLRTTQPDLLWTSLSRATIMGQIAGRLLEIPVVSWQHSARLHFNNRLILQRTCALTSRWVADSQAVKDFLISRLPIASEKVEIWPLFEARADAPQTSVWDGEGPFRLGSLGRIHEVKRFDVIVRAAARIREIDPALAARIHFTIGGEGPELTHLQALAKKLRVENLEFRGFVQQPAEFLAGLHAYLQPSRREGLCVAAHEAMQAALPVIASPVGEIANSVLHAETGWLCGVGDVDAVARAIMSLTENPKAAAQMGRAGRARLLTRFAPGSMAAAGHRILEKVERELYRGEPGAPRDAAAASIVRTAKNASELSQ